MGRELAADTVTQADRAWVTVLPQFLLKRPGHMMLGLATKFIRGLLRSRLLSAMVAAGLVIDAWVSTGDPRVASSLTVFLLFPLLCIWFADAMGNLQGVRFFGLARPAITRTTPGDFVALGGWILLLARVCVSLMLRA